MVVSFVSKKIRTLGEPHLRLHARVLEFQRAGNFALGNRGRFSKRSSRESCSVEGMGNSHFLIFSIEQP